MPKPSGKRTFSGCSGVFPVRTSQGFPEPPCPQASTPGPQGTRLLPAAKSMRPLCCLGVGHPPGCSSSHRAPPAPARRPVTGETQADSSSGLLLPAQLTQYFMCLLLNVVLGGGSEPLTVRRKAVPREGACHAREDKGCTPSQRHIFGVGGPPGRGCL